MAGQLIDHVIKKPDPRLHATFARAIKRDSDRNICLVGFSCDRSVAHRLFLDRDFRRSYGFGRPMESATALSNGSANIVAKLLTKNPDKSHDRAQARS
jgi:hypothetical protein